MVQINSILVYFSDCEKLGFECLKITKCIFLFDLFFSRNIYYDINSKQVILWGKNIELFYNSKELIIN